MIIWVHQMTPRVCCLKWIANDSAAPYGPGTQYRLVRIALPYVCTFVVFRRQRGGRMEMTLSNECFFRNGPLRTLDDKLLYPALLNCSRFVSGEGHPLSWLCTQHLNFRALATIADTNQYMRAALTQTLSCLWETGFNRSSEEHEGDSWFSETVRRQVDPRIQSVESWEEATKQNPLFAVEVAWLETGKSVRDVVNRIFDINRAHEVSFQSASELARLVFNGARATPQRSKGVLFE